MNDIQIEKIDSIKKSDIISLRKKLISMLYEQFNLNIHIKSGQLKQLHLLKKIRRGIASIKYYVHNKNI